MYAYIPVLVTLLGAALTNASASPVVVTSVDTIEQTQTFTKTITSCSNNACVSSAIVTKCKLRPSSSTLASSITLPLLSSSPPSTVSPSTTLAPSSTPSVSLGGTEEPDMFTTCYTYTLNKSVYTTTYTCPLSETSKFSTWKPTFSSDNLINTATIVSVNSSETSSSVTSLSSNSTSSVSSTERSDIFTTVFTYTINKSVYTTIYTCPLSETTKFSTWTSVFVPTGVVSSAPTTDSSGASIVSSSTVDTLTSSEKLSCNSSPVMSTSNVTSSSVPILETSVYQSLPIVVQDVSVSSSLSIPSVSSSGELVSVTESSFSVVATSSVVSYPSISSILSIGSTPSVTLHSIFSPSVSPVSSTPSIASTVSNNVSVLSASPKVILVSLVPVEPSTVIQFCTGELCSTSSNLDSSSSVMELSSSSSSSIIAVSETTLPSFSSCTDASCIVTLAPSSLSSVFTRSSCNGDMCVSSSAPVISRVILSSLSSLGELVEISSTIASNLIESPATMSTTSEIDSFTNTPTFSSTIPLLSSTDSLDLSESPSISTVDIPLFTASSSDESLDISSTIIDILSEISNNSAESAYTITFPSAVESSYGVPTSEVASIGFPEDLVIVANSVVIGSNTYPSVATTTGVPFVCSVDESMAASVVVSGSITYLTHVCLNTQVTEATTTPTASPESDILSTLVSENDSSLVISDQLPQFLMSSSGYYGPPSLVPAADDILASPSAFLPIQLYNGTITVTTEQSNGTGTLLSENTGVANFTTNILQVGTGSAESSSPLQIDQTSGSNGLARNYNKGLIFSAFVGLMVLVI